MADAFVGIAIYSLVTICFPDNRTKYLGYTESAMGIGLMIGPVLGEIVYKQLGYEYTFLTFAGILVAGGVLAFVLLPQQLNQLKISEYTK